MEEMGRCTGKNLWTSQCVLVVVNSNYDNIFSPLANPTNWMTNLVLNRSNVVTVRGPTNIFEASHFFSGTAGSMGDNMGVVTFSSRLSELR